MARSGGLQLTLSGRRATSVAKKKLAEMNEAIFLTVIFLPRSLACT